MIQSLSVESVIEPAFALANLPHMISLSCCDITKFMPLNASSSFKGK